MEEWYMKLDLRTGELDLSGLCRRELTDFPSPSTSFIKIAVFEL